MYNLRHENMYEKEGNRITQARDGYIFYADNPHSGLYAKSPYYIGATMWNGLRTHTQNLNSKERFKCDLKRLWSD